MLYLFNADSTDMANPTTLDRYAVEAKSILD